MDAYLLGAGFSKAMHSAMPTLKELGPQIIAELKRDGHLRPDDEPLAPFAGDVEAWLSHLSTSEPWNTEDADLENQALFVKASRVINKVITTSTPDWGQLAEDSRDVLTRLAHHWSLHRSPILTFNYDLIVEQAIQERIRELPAYPGASGDKDRLIDYYALTLTFRRVFTPFFSASKATDDIPTLYKLHGSVNWLYSGLEAPQAPVVLKEEQDPKFGHEHIYDDLSPLIIPPTNSKSVFYNHRALRAQWHNAYEVLRAADRLIVMGYSLPPTDLQVRTMLGMALREGTEVIVIDRCPEVAERWKHLRRDLHVQGIHGDAPVADYVEAQCEYVATWRATVDQPPSGEQHLTVQGRLHETRPWTREPSPIEAAMGMLVQSWPSMEKRWKTISNPEIGVGKWEARMIVSRDDYQRCPNPWNNDT